MSIRKRIAALGAALVMMMSMSAVGASAATSAAKSYTLKNADVRGKDSGTKTIYDPSSGYEVGELEWHWTGSKGYSKCTSDGYKHFAVVKGNKTKTTGDKKATVTATTGKVSKSSKNTVYYGGTVLLS